MLGKLLLRFLLLLALSAILLIGLPLLGSDRPYTAFYRAFGNVMFRQFWIWPDGSIRFLDYRLPTERLIAEINAELPRPVPPTFRPPRRPRAQDTLLMLKNRKTPGSVGLLGTSAVLLGYWPTAMFLALVLAKPLPWKRKGWAILWGMLLVHAFILFRLSAQVVAAGFAADKSYALFSLSPFWMDVVKRVEEIVAQNPTVSFAASLFILFAVAFTREDWARISEGGFGSEPDDPPEEPAHSPLEK